MASQRLIQYFAQSQGGYEVYTSMLWIDILGNFFPPSTPDSWLYGPEFAWSNAPAKGRCDLVLSQSSATWPPPNSALGLPFFAVEFKSNGADDQEWAKAKAQLDGFIAYLIAWRNKSQSIFGMIAAGNLCVLYQLQNGALVQMHQGRLNLADQNDLGQIEKLLLYIQSLSPVSTAHVASARL